MRKDSASQTYTIVIHFETPHSTTGKMDGGNRYLSSVAHGSSTIPSSAKPRTSIWEEGNAVVDSSNQNLPVQTDSSFKSPSQVGAIEAGTFESLESARKKLEDIRRRLQTDMDNAAASPIFGSSVPLSSWRPDEFAAEPLQSPMRVAPPRHSLKFEESLGRNEGESNEDLNMKLMAAIKVLDGFGNFWDVYERTIPNFDALLHSFHNELISSVGNGSNLQVMSGNLCNEWSEVMGGCSERGRSLLADKLAFESFLTQEKIGIEPSIDANSTPESVVVFLKKSSSAFRRLLTENSQLKNRLQSSTFPSISDISKELEDTKHALEALTKENVRLSEMLLAAPSPASSDFTESRDVTDLRAQRKELKQQVEMLRKELDKAQSSMQRRPDDALRLAELEEALEQMTLQRNALQLEVDTGNSDEQGIRNDSNALDGTDTGALLECAQEVEREAREVQVDIQPEDDAREQRCLSLAQKTLLALRSAFARENTMEDFASGLSGSPGGFFDLTSLPDEEVSPVALGDSMSSLMVDAHHDLEGLLRNIRALVKVLFTSPKSAVEAEENDANPSPEISNEATPDVDVSAQTLPGGLGTPLDRHGAELDVPDWYDVEVKRLRDLLHLREHEAEDARKVLELRSAELDAAISSIETLKSALQNSEDDLNTARLQCKENAVALSDMEEKVLWQTEQLDALSGDLSEVRGEKSVMAEQLRYADAESVELRSAVERAQESLISLEAEHIALESESAELREQLKIKEGQVDEGISHCQELEAKVKSMEELESELQELRPLKEGIRSLQAMLDDTSSQLQTSQQSLNEVQNLRNGFTAHVAQHADTVRRLELRYEEERDAKDKLRMKLSELEGEKQASLKGPNPVSELQALLSSRDRECTSLQSEVTALKEKADRLQAAVTDAQRDSLKYSEQRLFLEQQLQASGEAGKELSATCEMLRKEVELLRGVLPNPVAHIEREKEILLMEHQASMLTEKLKAAELRADERVEFERASQANAAAAFERSLADVQHQLQNSRQEASSLMNREAAAVAQIAEVQKELQKCRDASRNLEMSISRLEDEVRSKTAKIEIIEQSLAKADREERRVLSELKGKEEELDRARQRMSEEIASRKVLEAQLGDVRSTLEAKLVHEVNKERDRYSDLKQETEKVEAALRKQTMAVAREQDSLKLARQDAETMAAKLQEAHKETHDARNRNESLQKTISVHTAEIAHLQERLKNQLQTTESLETALRKQSTEKEKMQTLIDTVRRESEELNIKLAGTVVERKELSDRLARAGRELDDEKNENARLSSEAGHQQKNILSIEADRDRLTGEVKHLQKELEFKSTEVASVRSKMRFKDEEIKNLLANSNASPKPERRSSKNEVNDGLLQKIRSLEGELVNLRQEKKSESQDYAESAQAIAGVRAELEESQASLRESIRESQRWQEKFHALESDFMKLDERKSDLLKQLQMLNEVVSSTHPKDGDSDAEGRIDGLRASLRASMEENEALNTRISELGDQNRDLESQVDGLETEISQLKEDLQDALGGKAQSEGGRTAEVESQASRVRMLEEERVSLKESLNSLAGKLKQAEKDREEALRELRDSYLSPDNNMDTGDQGIPSLETSNAVWMELSREEEQLRSAIDTLTKSPSKRTSQSEHALHELQSLLDDAVKQRSDARMEAEKFSIEVSALRDENSNLKRECSALSESISLLEQRVHFSEHPDEVQLSAEERIAMESSLRRAQEILGTYESEMDELLLENNALKESMEAHKAYIDQVWGTLPEVSQCMNELLGSELKKVRHGFVETSEQLQQNIKELEDSNMELRRKLNDDGRPSSPPLSQVSSRYTMDLAQGEPTSNAWQRLLDSYVEDVDAFDDIKDFRRRAREEIEDIVVSQHISLLQQGVLANVYSRSGKAKLRLLVLSSDRSQLKVMDAKVGSTPTAEAPKNTFVLEVQQFLNAHLGEDAMFVATRKIAPESSRLAFSLEFSGDNVDIVATSSASMAAIVDSLFGLTSRPFVCAESLASATLLLGIREAEFQNSKQVTPREGAPMVGSNAPDLPPSPESTDFYY